MEVMSGGIKRYRVLLENRTSVHVIVSTDGDKKNLTLIQIQDNTNRGNIHLDSYDVQSFHETTDASVQDEDAVRNFIQKQFHVDILDEDLRVFN